MSASLIKIQKRTKASLALILALFLVFTSFSTLFVARAHATGQLSSASVQISDPRPGIGGSSLLYNVKFTTASTATLKCVKVQFTTTAAGSTEPTGMVTTSAAKGTITGMTNGSWTLYNTNDGAPQAEFSTGESISASTAVTIPINTLTNPTSASTFYAQITTYNTLTTHTCSGVVDTITVAWATTTGIYTSVTVDPTLTFAVNLVGSAQTVNSDTTTVASTATTIPFGTVAGNAVGIAAHDLVVTTNAAGGYTVYASYSAALTDGAAHAIADAAGTNNAPATFGASTTTSAFGYTTASTTLSGSAGTGAGQASRFASTKYAAFTTAGLEVARATSAVNSDTTRVGYKVAISNTQAPGTYTTTVGLVATPTY